MTRHVPLRDTCSLRPRHFKFSPMYTRTSVVYTHFFLESEAV